MGKYQKGDFTLPGEAGYEVLTLELAEKWGADVIRDSDGTKLSDEILKAGYLIYSTICVIREHNAFINAHPEVQQQTFLSSRPVIAVESDLAVDLLDGYLREQFELNASEEAMAYWQVWDRTANRAVKRSDWSYSEGKVCISNCSLWHEYTVSFLCWRIWEEINMYNYRTNGWTGEHLRQLDPRHPLAWEYLVNWMDNWCRSNPQTNVVRLTSLFYNFVWIFGDDPRHMNCFTDWSSYDYTVSPAALKAFEAEYGYALTAEDFINGGKLHAAHTVPDSRKRDYMDFIQRFVAEKAQVLVDIIHSYGKKAYMFYDDSWVGSEPCGRYFSTIGLDGIIKCVFSGFECRLCAEVNVPVHELRFHPYLFPVGLGGLPTFSENGHPEKDAMAYWLHVRRALARKCVDRIGLGGYLHLTEDYPEFTDTIRQIAVEFRKLKELHQHGRPYTLPCRVAVLHSWGKLRPWTLSGHFHETYMHPLIHVNEALSGLPVDVRFIDFSDVEAGALNGVDVLINAGRAGDAWSGGDAWKSDAVVERIREFVYNGGGFVGVGEPSAVSGYASYFRLADVLGIDEDTGAYVCHGRWAFDVQNQTDIRICSDSLGSNRHLFLKNGKTRVLCEKDGVPQMTIHDFGRGKAVYMSDFSVSQASTAMLMDIMQHVGKCDDRKYLSADGRIEVHYFPADATVVAMNNAEEVVETVIDTEIGAMKISLKPLEMQFIRIDG